jgi:hypothetical protein
MQWSRSHGDLMVISSLQSLLDWQQLQSHKASDDKF